MTLPTVLFAITLPVAVGEVAAMSFSVLTAVSTGRFERAEVAGPVYRDEYCPKKEKREQIGLCIPNEEDAKADRGAEPPRGARGVPAPLF